jgi:hypothetical protein
MSKDQAAVATCDTTFDGIAAKPDSGECGQRAVERAPSLPGRWFAIDAQRGLPGRRRARLGQ